MDTQIRDMAVKLAAAGIPVLPLHGINNGGICTCSRGDQCRSTAKHPRLKHGLRDADVDAAKVAGWWRQWPNAGLGVVTGECSKVIVLDVDSRHAGEESLATLLKQHGELPETTVVRTGGGGWHYFFAHPGYQVPNASNLWPGVDCRGDGGYVCFPPTLHASGRRYEFVGTDMLDVSKLPPAPTWLLEALQQRSSGGNGRAKPAANEDDRVARAAAAMRRLSVDDRNDGSLRLLKAARATVRYDLDLATAVETIQSYLREQPTPRAYSPAEIEQRVHDAEQRNTRGAALRRRRTRSNGQPPSETEPDLPVVCLPGGPMRIVDTAFELGQLLAVTRKFFVRVSSVVRLLHKTEAPELCPVQAVELCSAAERVARLVSYYRGDLIPAVCSETKAKQILNAAEFKAPLPKIRGVFACPVLVEHGDKLEFVSGYNAKAQLLASKGEIEDLSLDDARDRIEELLADFQFATDSDKSRAAAMLLAPALIMGGLLNGRAPLHVLEADQPQTGKSYAIKVLAALYGAHAATITQRTGGVGGLGEAFDAALVRGAPFISIDNARGEIDSQAIESFLTEDFYNARIPYHGYQRIDARGVFVTLTSNAAELTPDLAARSSIIRLVKQPPGHYYAAFESGDLLAHVRANRDYFLSAMFAIVRVWHEQGKQSNRGVDHDFRVWAGTLDWIVTGTLGMVPLLERHRAALAQTTTPSMGVIREITLAVQRSEMLHTNLHVAELAEIMRAHKVEAPDLNFNHMVAGSEFEKRDLMTLGGFFSRVCRSGPVEIDGRFQMSQRREKSTKYGEVKLYRFEAVRDASRQEAAKSKPKAPPSKNTEAAKNAEQDRKLFDEPQQPGRSGAWA